MDSQDRLARSISYGSVVCGLFVLYWGIVSIVSAAYVPSVTIPWLDRAMVGISDFVWLPAAGVLLVVLGVVPTALPRARNSRIVRALAGLFGIGFLCLGGFFVLITLSPFWGFVYVSPLFVIGVLLLILALDTQQPGRQRQFSS